MFVMPARRQPRRHILRIGHGKGESHIDTRQRLENRKLHKKSVPQPAMTCRRLHAQQIMRCGGFHRLDDAFARFQRLPFARQHIATECAGTLDIVAFGARQITVQKSLHLSPLRSLCGLVLG
ncbi:MAG: hypothetical protein WA138_08460 [Parvibaculum sp.]